MFIQSSLVSVLKPSPVFFQKRFIKKNRIYNVKNKKNSIFMTLKNLEDFDDSELDPETCNNLFYIFKL